MIDGLGFTGRRQGGKIRGGHRFRSSRLPVPFLSVFVCSSVLPVALFSRVARGECVETAPAGTERPKLVDSFPRNGTSGYAATLHVVVSHGKGETVLPRGLELQTQSDTARALQGAGFALPNQDGGCAPETESAAAYAARGVGCARACAVLGNGRCGGRNRARMAGGSMAQAAQTHGTPAPAAPAVGNRAGAARRGGARRATRDQRRP